MTREIDLSKLYDNQAKIDHLETYKQEAVKMAGEGKEVILTGAAPIWMYLAIAHALHGKAKRLLYRSPVVDIEIFNHDPF